MKPTILDLGNTDRNPIHIKYVDCPALDTPFHIHPYCELVLIVKGSGQRVVGDNIENYSKNDLVLVGPNLPHIWRSHNSDGTENTVAIVIYFDQSFFNKIVDKQTLAQIKALFNYAKRGLKINGNLLNKLSNDMFDILPLKGFALTARFISMIETILRSDEYVPLSSSGFQNIFTTKEASRVDIVYKYVMDNFNRSITLEEIADVANLTTNSFCRFFKQCTQKSFSQFVNEVRISHACRLLANESIPINQICIESGFQNITNFNRFFKEITGTTPMLYRKNITSLTEVVQF